MTRMFLNMAACSLIGPDPPTPAELSSVGVDVMLPFENSVVETLQPGVVLFQLHRGF